MTMGGCRDWGFSYPASKCETCIHYVGRSTAEMQTLAKLLVFIGLAIPFENVAAAPAAVGPSVAQLSQVERFLADAQNAEKTGNLHLALIQLKNAAVLQPENGEIRARLGIDLLRAGQAANAERELRQAYKDFGPPDLVIPGLLNTMLQRKEFKELLAEFPDPLPAAEDRTTPDILSARALALQMLGQAKDARAAIKSFACTASRRRWTGCECKACTATGRSCTRRKSGRGGRQAFAIERSGLDDEDFACRWKWRSQEGARRR